jgi:hypothetical protein
MIEACRRCGAAGWALSDLFTSFLAERFPSAVRFSYLVEFIGVFRKYRKLARTSLWLERKPGQPGKRGVLTSKHLLKHLLKGAKR